MTPRLWTAAFAVLMPISAQAATPRDALTQALFTARDKATALAQVSSVEASAGAALARSPGDDDAMLTRAIAAGYRAKINRNRTEALAAKAQFEALVARNPRNAEAQAALGGWHLGAITSLGSLVARGGLGARKTVGLKAIDASVALGGDRALFRGLAALFRLELDPRDPQGRSLAEAAMQGSTPTPLDRIIQHRAGEMLIAMKNSDPKLIQALARRLLPLGQIKL